MALHDWPQIHKHIFQFEQEGLVTRRFRRLDHDRQRAILTSILEEAVENGPIDINIKQVATRANVAVGSLYAYFGNRDGLLDFTIELCARHMQDSINYDSDNLDQPTLREALAEYVAGGIEWSEAQTGLVHYFVRVAFHGNPILSERVVKPVAKAMQGAMHKILTRAFEKSEMRKNVDFEALTRVVYALMIAVCDSQVMPYLNTYFQLTDDEVSRERIINALLDFVECGVSNTI
jgi:AcrR family transcriptional regulator